MIQTIIDKNTEQVLYSTTVEIELQENEVLIDGESGDFTHYNLITKEFYKK